MTKKGNLAAALTSFDRRPASVPESTLTEPASHEKESLAVSREEGGKTVLPPSRQGKRALTGYFDPEVVKQLKVLAVAEDKTVQALMSEALNELFKKYKKPHIA